ALTPVRVVVPAHAYLIEAQRVRDRSIHLFDDLSGLGPSRDVGLVRDHHQPVPQVLEQPARPPYPRQEGELRKRTWRQRRSGSGLAAAVQDAIAVEKHDPPHLTAASHFAVSSAMSGCETSMCATSDCIP